MATMRGAKEIEADHRYRDEVGRGRLTFWSFLRNVCHSFGKRGFLLQLEVLLEELNTFAAEVGRFAGSVSGSRDHVEGEVLVGLDEVVDDLVGGGGVDVFVQFADGEHEVAL